MIIFNLIILIVSILLVVSIVVNLKKSNKNKSNIIMSKDSTLTLRGAAIIGILIHHCSQYFDGLGPFQLIIKQSGYALTAVFFLFSGYGCWHSLKKLSGGSTSSRLSKTFKWVLNHSLRIWFDFVVVFFINILIFKAFNVTEGMSVTELLKDFFTITEPTWVSWYPKIQIACYIVLAIAFLIKNEKKELITIVVTFIYILSAYKIGVASMWYSSVICFPIGLIFAKYLSEYSISKKTLTSISAMSFVVFGLLFFLQINYYTSILRTISVVFLALFIVSLSGLVEFNSKILKAIGNISFEIYLIHLFLLRIADIKDFEPNASIFAIFLLSLLMSYPINKFVELINKKIFSDNKKA